MFDSTKSLARAEHSEQDIEKTIEVAGETIIQLKDSENH